jgi:N-methylhydantoinase B/oxoprolinase/acetone carboxylase alpha subunit
LKRAHEVVELVLAGGSGYGPPEDRSEELLALDRQLGFVSDAGARQDYGRDGRPAAQRSQATPALATASACPPTLVP